MISIKWNHIIDLMYFVILNNDFQSVTPTEKDITCDIKSSSSITNRVEFCISQSPFTFLKKCL